MTLSSFSMTFAIFHDFPGLENGLTKFHDQGAPCLMFSTNDRQWLAQFIHFHWQSLPTTRLLHRTDVNAVTWRQRHSQNRTTIAQSQAVTA